MADQYAVMALSDLGDLAPQVEGDCVGQSVATVNDTAKPDRAVGLTRTRTTNRARNARRGTGMAPPGCGGVSGRSRDGVAACCAHRLSRLSSSLANDRAHRLTTRREH